MTIYSRNVNTASTLLYCPVLYCTVLYCTVLSCSQCKTLTSKSFIGLVLAAVAVFPNTLDWPKDEPPPNKLMVTELHIKQEQVSFFNVSKCSLYMFYNNPAPLNGSTQFHYCTDTVIVTQEPEQTTLLFWSAACGVTPHGLHAADQR